MVEYIPARGDVVWLDFDPQKGKEIKKTRPAIVVSPKDYNQKTHLALFMPITSKIKGYPFEVILNEGKIQGSILCDQVRSLDWRARNVRFVMKLSPEIMDDILAKLMVLLV